MPLNCAPPLEKTDKKMHRMQKIEPRTGLCMQQNTNMLESKKC
jgi:hypothetical protein